ncbi:MAG: condensation domain-containing protein, partial [Firmicutes bacterium]|nr:condensation domain-containing protein [Bacillota bacterium]
MAVLAHSEFEMPPMPSYEEQVNREKAYLNSDAYERDAEYWSAQIEKFGGERAHLKKNSNLNISNTGDRCSFKFSEPLNHAIAAFCRSNRVAPFAVYCIALCVHLKRVSGCANTCIGVPIVNRRDFVDKQTGGMFVNTLPFFYTVDTDLNAGDLIRSLTEQWYDLLRRQRFPFAEIAAINSQKNEAADRLFDIAL